QWKQFLDQSIDAWSRALGQAMNTEAFAQMLGRTLDQFLVVQAPLKKAADQQIEAGLQAFNMPSRTQVTALARQVVEVDERVERLEDAIAAVMRRLDQIARLLSDREPASRGSRDKEPR
ncbi:MAG: poly(R)-hydroxyalkanoic acid synthase subunit PhaE, partial [Candidatus Rokuibacteriota bacterium]